MPYGDKTLSIVDELLEGKPLEYTINRRLSEGHGFAGNVTTNIRKVGRGVSSTLTGITGKLLLAVASGVAVWITNQLIQKWLISSKVKGKHSKIIQASYEPMIRDVLRALQPALTAATRRVSQGQVVDADRIVAKERAKVIRIIDAHFMEMVKRLRVDIQKTIMDDVTFKLDEALTTHVPQAMNDPEQYGTQTPTIHF